MSLPIAITCGDPAGIGPETIAACLNAPLGLSRPVAVLGPAAWLETLKPDASNKVEYIEIDATDSIELGQPSDVSARVALHAMELAAKGCLSGKFASVVTGPISKARCAAVGFEYPGQTEFFASRWGGIPSMGFVGERLKVVLATWHIPLREVPAALDSEALRRAVERAAALAAQLGASEPRIAVCGLNPHAGENGLLGNEEADSIDPVLDEMRESFSGLSPCLPADTVFYRAMKGEFDVVIALYHDQGLAPLKAVEFDKAVNVTLGLPFVRTSPDHGTAYGIAGKGIAAPGSFREAIRLADKLQATD